VAIRRGSAASAAALSLGETWPLPRHSLSRISRTGFFFFLGGVSSRVTTMNATPRHFVNARCCHRDRRGASRLNSDPRYRLIGGTLFAHRSWRDPGVLVPATRAILTLCMRRRPLHRRTSQPVEDRDIHSIYSKSPRLPSVMAVEPPAIRSAHTHYRMADHT